jgi:predicted PhzF superfamily epimerase YddE/YHI9
VGDAVDRASALHHRIDEADERNRIEIAGTVVAKLMETAGPVEYGEALFAIRPR